MLIDGERRIPLFSNRWGGGTIAPKGHLNIESFHLEGHMLVWRYAIGDIVIESHYRQDIPAYWRKQPATEPGEQRNEHADAVS